MEKIKINPGDKFGRLTIIKEVKKKKGTRYAFCQCDCGNKKTVNFYSLRSGVIVSCGCYHSEKTKYINYKNGLYKTRLHGIWLNMKQRCCNPNYRRYKSYGGRGIKIDDKWLESFKNFYDWSMANGYKDDLTIDRIDNDDGYNPYNCRWITNKEQQNNKRNNRYIEYKGEIKTLQEWSELLNINYKTLQKRLDSGWSIADTFTFPIQNHRRNIGYEA